MPHTPSIQILNLRKKGVMGDKLFFQNLSSHNNYVEPAISRDFYMGLVRMLTAELRKSGVVHLPHLGDFALVKAKDRLGWSGKFQMMQVGKYMLKFYPNTTWRKYFSKLSEKTGREGLLDPREKLFGNTLE
jgi:hypothetical protein